MPGAKGAAPNLAPLVKPVSSLLGVGRPTRGRVALRGALALLPALALFAACADDEPPAAAVVDGTEISEQSVVDELEAIAANADYLDTLEQGGRDVLGEEDGTFS